MSKIGSMFLFVAFVLLAAPHSPTAADGAVFNNQSPPMAGAAAATSTNDVLLEKFMRLEDRFDKEMNEAKGSIVSLERQNEKLTGEFSAAKERIVSLEGEVQRLSGLLLRQSAQPNRRHADAAAAAVGSANDNSQSMTGQIESEADEAKIRAIVTPPPTSCADLAQLGNRITGFHLVLDKESNNRIQTVYCDFALAYNNPDYETAIGYNDIKTAPTVSFYVQRSSTYSSNQTVIPYEVTRLNIGGAINIVTGVFTAHVNGRYHFSFTAESYNGKGAEVYLRLNGLKIAVTQGSSDTVFDNLPLVATFQLKKGDTVDVWLLSGSIYDDSIYRFTQFSGFLLEEDLVLI